MIGHKNVHLDEKKIFLCVNMDSLKLLAHKILQPGVDKMWDLVEVVGEGEGEAGARAV